MENAFPLDIHQIVILDGWSVSFAHGLWIRNKWQWCRLRQFIQTGGFLIISYLGYIHRQRGDDHPPRRGWPPHHGSIMIHHPITYPSSQLVSYPQWHNTHVATPICRYVENKEEHAWHGMKLKRMSLPLGSATLKRHNPKCLAAWSMLERNPHVRLQWYGCWPHFLNHAKPAHLELVLRRANSYISWPHLATCSYTYIHWMAGAEDRMVQSVLTQLTLQSASSRKNTYKKKAPSLSDFSSSILLYFSEILCFSASRKMGVARRDINPIYHP